MKYLIFLAVSICALAAASTQDPSRDRTETQPQKQSATISPSNDKSGNQRPNRQPAQTDRLYWIFLTTGKSTDDVDREEIERMQAEHLANFKRLASENKLLTAGPLNDPENKLRGIVVVRAKAKSEIAKMFVADPYVQLGYLKVEPAPMEISHGKINTRVTPQGLEEFRLVLLRRANDDTALLETPARQKTTDHIASLTTLKNFLLSVDFQEPKHPWQSILVFKAPDGEDDSTLTDVVDKIPAVNSGDWKAKMLPLYLGKGSLDKNQ